MSICNNNIIILWEQRQQHNEANSSNDNIMSTNSAYCMPGTILSMCVLVHVIPLRVLSGGSHYHPHLTEGKGQYKRSATLPQITLLGHSRTRVTQSYACVTPGDLAKASEHQGAHLSSVSTEHWKGQICWWLQYPGWAAWGGRAQQTL